MFSPEEIRQARKERKLLSLDIELTKRCNFKCIYCYAAREARPEHELTAEELFAVIDEALALGLRTMTLTGGEPLLDPKYFTVARYARERGISILLFTNGSTITREVAAELMELRVSPCIKLDALSEKIQDCLAGTPGAHQQILRGIKNLIEAGFSTEHPVLAVNATVCRENLRELPALWSWARSQGISPSLTRLQPMGRAYKRPHLAVAAAELEELFRSLSEIDQRFGFFWDPVIPWPQGKACRRHYIGCFIDSQGNVQPCSGVPLRAGSIRQHRLGDILATAAVFKQARDMEHEVEGACRSCAYHMECYGCRSLAYWAGEGFTGADPLCWHSQKTCRALEESTGMPRTIPVP